MLLSFLKDLLFPIECLGCQQPGSLICQKCFRCIKPGGPEISRPAGETSLLERLYVAGDYNDPLLAEMIKKFKYNFMIGLEAPLADFLSLFWAGQLALDTELSQALLVPIPLARRRELWRGFNQAERLAAGLADRLGLEMARILIRDKPTRPQASLSDRERKQNVRGAFKAVMPVPAGRLIILIDDVATTGATLEAAAEALKDAGARRLAALVVAKG